MRKLLVVMMVCGLFLALVGCDEHIETKEYNVDGVVTYMDVDEVFDEYETKTITKNGKTKTIEVADYDDILTVQVEYYHDDGILMDYIELDLEDDEWEVELLDDYREGDKIPCVLVEDIYRVEETGELYSRFRLEIDVLDRY